LSWCRIKKQNIEALLKCQKRLLRIINKAQFLESCKGIFKDLGLLTVPSLIILESCLLVRKNLKHLSNDSGKVARYNTRRKIPRLLHLDGHSSNFNICIDAYNKLPETLKEEQKCTTFKRKLEEYLCGRCLYSLEEYFSND